MMFCTNVLMSLHLGQYKRFHTFCRKFATSRDCIVLLLQFFLYAVLSWFLRTFKYTFQEYDLENNRISLDSIRFQLWWIFGQFLVIFCLLAFMLRISYSLCTVIRKSDNQRASTEAILRTKFFSYFLYIGSMMMRFRSISSDSFFLICCFCSLTWGILFCFLNPWSIC